MNNNLYEIEYPDPGRLANALSAIMVGVGKITHDALSRRLAELEAEQAPVDVKRQAQFEKALKNQHKFTIIPNFIYTDFSNISYAIFISRCCLG